MHKLSDSAGSISNSETFGYDGNFGEASSGKKFYQDLIKKANSVPITKLFKYYNLYLNEQNKKIICPFSTHKGGRENSPSFYFYPSTNSFWCFGCKIGTRCCDFISNMDGISKTKSAFKILKLFNDDVDDDAILINKENFSERLEIILSFSNSVRDFRCANSDVKDHVFIENICSAYDSINAKFDLSNEALKFATNQLKKKLTITAQK